MLQRAYAGNNLDNSNFFETGVLNYFEPGFNMFTPLEFEVSESDKIYFAMKKRSDYTGKSFDDISSNQYEIEVKDVTSGEIVQGVIDNRSVPNALNPSWNSDFTTKELFITIDTKNVMTLRRYRVIECVINNRITYDSISFVVSMQETSDTMFFMIIDSSNLVDRPRSSTLGKNCLIYVEQEEKINFGTTQTKETGSSYILLSPFDYFKEVGKDDGYMFEYPSNTYFYERNVSSSNEDYDFFITGASHDFILDNIDIFTVPNFHKIGVLTIDKKMFLDLTLQNVLSGFSRAYIDIQSVGKVSESTNTFRVNFLRQ